MAVSPSSNSGISAVANRSLLHSDYLVVCCCSRKGPPAGLVLFVGARWCVIQMGEECDCSAGLKLVLPTWLPPRTEYIRAGCLVLACLTPVLPLSACHLVKAELTFG